MRFCILGEHIRDSIYFDAHNFETLEIKLKTYGIKSNHFLMIVSPSEKLKDVLITEEIASITLYCFEAAEINQGTFYLQIFKKNDWHDALGYINELVEAEFGEQVKNENKFNLLKPN